ncbi:MAG: mco [Firmicutes bacterium]|nr:mco [Bacillota bacterium]
MYEWNNIRPLSFKAAILISISVVLTACNGLKTEFDSQQEHKLKLPVILEDTNSDPGVAEFSLEASEGRTEFAEGFPADTIGYNGSYLGPVLRFSSGEKVTIHVKNSLSFPTTVHWHGLVVEGEMDGGPHQGIMPGESWSPDFTVDQPAATLWYHPHLMGSSADQVYFGLAGLIYIDDEVSEGLNLPDNYGVNDIPLIVQDRNFRSDGYLDYRTSMMGVVPGDTILINGTLNPYLDVNRETVRFRILNASNSENFNFRFSDDSSFQQIASDGGFLEEPISRESLILAPGERAEIIVDFTKSGRDTISLMNGNSPILDFNISGKEMASAAIPDFLSDIAEIPEGDNPRVRVFELQSMGVTGTINGKSFDMDRIDEDVPLKETEIWVIRNLGGMMQTSGHPFHVHGTQFQVISRDGKDPPLEERGWKDTVFVKTGEEVKIKVRFSKEGVFMYHCHILEHEDGGMMGQFRVQ